MKVISKEYLHAHASKRSLNRQECLGEILVRFLIKQIDD